MSSAKLGGCLIGYGIKKKDGTFRQVMFDCPIHNTITKHCLNNLLTFDGTNASPSTNLYNNVRSLFVKSSGNSERYGVINACALGDGTGETATDDTELKHRVTTHSVAKFTGTGWCGTRYDTTNGIVKLRISHIHNILENFTVKEIGWYYASYPDMIYTLSARVQLDKYVDVEAGDTFYSIYELSVGFQDVEKFDDLAGLGGGYKVNAINRHGNGTDQYSWYYTVGVPQIDTSGNGYQRLLLEDNPGDGWPDWMGQFFPAWWNIASGTGYDSRMYNAILPITHAVNKTKGFDVLNYYSFWGASNYARIITPKAYTPDSFYRDVDIVIQNLPSNIYALGIFGTLYCFGTFDENDVFTPTPVTFSGALKVTVRQSWSTDLLSPSA